ncbi:MAG: O-antigen ligase family protein [Ignavibacteria bacterium]|nr:O-antigen ligase family protein [Ignavibacteria bacterium]MDP3830860.1 O-antigen ligase family protein [Ignavibacteriaceae bacterium]
MTSSLFHHLRAPSLIVVVFVLILGLIGLFVTLSELKNLHIVLTLLPVLFLLLNNFRYSFFYLILLLFVNLHIYTHHISVYFAFAFILSYLMCFYDRKFKDLVNPLSVPISIYLFLSLPSFINNQEIPNSLFFMSSMLISFVILHFISASDDKKLIPLFIISFLVFCFINGLSAAYEGLINQKRAFGFAGVMFVDYISIGVVITFVTLVLSNKKVFYSLLLALFFLFSIIHQTRGVWLVLAMTLLIILSFFFFHNQMFEIKKGKLVVFIGATVLLLTTGFVLVTGINPDVEQRATQFNESKSYITQEGDIDNSLVTRALIWHTALNAFKEHPILGIGSHSFSFQSHRYSTISPYLYKKYVKALTPHGTYFAVLPEIGIIGLIGFLLLAFFTLKYSYSNIKASENMEDKRISTILYFILVYINISMIITDAWLFGSGAVLWCIILGLNMLQKKSLLKEVN